MNYYKLKETDSWLIGMDKNKVYSARELKDLLGFGTTAKFTASAVCRKYFEKVSWFDGRKETDVFDELGVLKATHGLSSGLRSALVKERGELLRKIQVIDTLLKT